MTHLRLWVLIFFWKSAEWFLDVESDTLSKLWTKNGRGYNYFCGALFGVRGCDDVNCDCGKPWESIIAEYICVKERKVMVELVSYIKGIGLLLHKEDTLVADALWETIHVEAQDFVQYTSVMMLRTSFCKKKDLSRILSYMRTHSAYWMANTRKHESDMKTFQHGGE